MSLVRSLLATALATAALPLHSTAHAQNPPVVKPTPAPAPVAAAPANDAAWDAAQALKRKASYADAARAFEAWAQANAGQPRVGEALTEAGVCWFSLGRSQLKLLRPTKESTASFDSALATFDRVLALGATPYGARAQYMRGSVKFFAGDMPGADLEYGKVLDAWKTDAKYVPKALERRAMARRNRLATQDALADLVRYQREFPQGEEIESVRMYQRYLGQFERPAPPLVPEGWIQGDPVTLASFKGDVVLVYFFASWCENCENVRPFVLDLAARFEPMGVHFVGVVTHSKGQTIDSVRGFLAEKQIRFPVMMDASDPRSAEAGVTTLSYGSGKYPDVALIDRAGRLRWHDNPNNLPDSTIEALLLEDPQAAPGK